MKRSRAQPLRLAYRVDPHEAEPRRRGHQQRRREQKKNYDQRRVVAHHFGHGRGDVDTREVELAHSRRGIAHKARHALGLLAHGGVRRRLLLPVGDGEKPSIRRKMPSHSATNSRSNLLSLKHPGTAWLTATTMPQSDTSAPYRRLCVLVIAESTAWSAER